MDENMVEDITPLEKDAMDEMDDLVRQYRERDLKTRALRKEHEQALQALRVQKDKMAHLEMMGNHIKADQAQIARQLYETTDEKTRSMLRDRYEKMTQELCHIREQLSRGIMMMDNLEMKVEESALSIDRINHRPKINKAKVMQKNESFDGRDMRKQILKSLSEKMDEMDTQSLQNLLRLTERAKSEEEFIYDADAALLMIEPKVKLIRESNLYEMLAKEHKDRIEEMIEHYQKRIRRCQDPKLMAVLVNDFDKVAFARIFKKMAENID